MKNSEFFKILFIQGLPGCYIITCLRSEIVCRVYLCFSWKFLLARRLHTSLRFEKVILDSFRLTITLCFLKPAYRLLKVRLGFIRLAYTLKKVVKIAL